MKNILFIHQSADLYGSDKTLLYLVGALKTEINPIVVIPEEGPLTKELRKKDIEVIINPVIKVSRQLYASIHIFKTPFLVLKAIKSLDKKLGNRKIDIVHSNTLAVFLGAFYSKKYKIKHVWHVHEIIQYPKIIAKIYPFLVNYFSSQIIFNSKASYNHLCKNKLKLKNKSIVIYNGIERNTPFSSKGEKQLLRKTLFKSIAKSTIILGLIGRINKYKGHYLLLSVFEQLIIEKKDVKLLFIGSTINSQAYLLDKINSEIQKRDLNNHVTIIPFQKEVWKLYDIIDVVIVPTICLESFGLVALEGMLSKKPIIGSNNGGLKEIIKHNNTGLLFKPNSEPALKNAIKKLLSNQNLIATFGKEGEKRAKLYFSLKKYIDNFKDLYSQFG